MENGKVESMQLTVKKAHLSDREAKKIYFDAFPKEERMPYPLMVAMAKLWNTDFLLFFDEDLPIGMIYLAKNRKLVFIMFLAVAKEMRSKGYGSSILRYVKDHYQKKIIVSIEPCNPECPDFAVRQSRKKFYLRNSYEETGCRMKLNGTEQEILISGGPFSKKEFLTFFALYSNGTVWPKIWKE